MAHISFRCTLLFVVDEAEAVAVVKAKSGKVVPLFATLTPAVPVLIQQGAASALRLLEERHGFHIRFDAKTSDAQLVFDNVKQAEECLNGRMAATFSDNAYMVGAPEDPLVRAFHYVRINERLYHLIIYILEGQLTYDVATTTWNVSDAVKKASQRADINEWLDKYVLTPATWAAYQARPVCSICKIAKVPTNCSCPQLCLSCADFINRPIDATCTGACNNHAAAE